MLVAGVALTLIGCTTTQPTEPTGALGIAAAADRNVDGRRSADAWGERYRANPGDPEAALNYARALRSNGQRPQAVAVLAQAATQNPKHRGVLGAYGRALADGGHYKQAIDVLARAQAPGQPDWRILSVQGAALDQMGRHEEAQRYYGTALRIAPDEPSVLSNLGLSYALSKDLVRAEATLRQAAGQPRVDPRVRKISRWSWVCRDACPKRRASRARNCLRMKRPPMSPTCGKCWPCRTAGSSPRIPTGPSSERREADRFNGRSRFGCRRAPGGGESERGDQSDQQRGANQRYISHLGPRRP